MRSALSALLIAALTVGAVRAQPAIEPTIDLPPELASQRARVAAAAQAAVALLHEWFGALPSGTLRVTATRWQGVDAAAVRAGALSVPVRWLATVRDQSMERALISGVVAEYWLDESPKPDFRDAVVAYLSTRAIHHVLEGSNFAAPRFFGGHVSFALRSMLLSPPLGDPRPRIGTFDDRARPELPARVRALQTLERFLGWPTLLQAMSTMRAAGPSQWTVPALGNTLSVLMGIDVRALVESCFSNAPFDYSLEHLDSRPGASGLTETTLVIANHGTGRFAIGSDDDREPAVPIVVRFADGTVFRDTFDGAAPSSATPLTLNYSATAAAVSASIDPDAMLLLDTNRENNTIVKDASASRLGIRLALHWLAWLQNAMLSYTAVL